MGYPAPQASALVTFGIAGIAIALAALFVLGVWRVAGRKAAIVAALGSAGWLALTYGLAASGALARFDQRPPPFAFMFLTVIGGGLALGLSPLGKKLAHGLPLAALVGVQAFRLPLELVMHQAAVEGVMPHAMSFSGYNFDIVTGATALVLGLWLARGRVPRATLVAWNALGSVLLVVIAVVAFASTPLVRAFGDAPAQVNTWVAYPPFVWLPAILVLGAIAGHVMVGRRLLARETRSFPARKPGVSGAPGGEGVSR
jgi:hypothetical protein